MSTWWLMSRTSNNADNDTGWGGSKNKTIIGRLHEQDDGSGIGVGDGVIDDDDEDDDNDRWEPTWKPRECNLHTMNSIIIGLSIPNFFADNANNRTVKLTWLYLYCMHLCAWAELCCCCCECMSVRCVWCVCSYSEVPALMGVLAMNKYFDNPGGVNVAAIQQKRFLQLHTTPHSQRVTLHCLPFEDEMVHVTSESGRAPPA